MKKILTLLLLTVCSLTVLAGPLKVREGSTKVLKEDANAIFELDLTHCTFEKKLDFKTWCGNDYDVRVSLMNDYFPEFFNKYNKGLKIVSDSSTAKYKIKVHVDQFVRKLGDYFGATALMRIYGDVTITDINTGQTICKISIKKLNGYLDYVESDRFPKAMRRLAKKLADLK